MNETQPQSIENDNNPIIQKAYENIIAELKVMLRHYPEHHWCYNEVDEIQMPTVTCLRFYTPLFYVGLLEAYGQYTIQFARTIDTGSISTKDNIALMRCLLKHTNANLTEMDIEDHVMELTWEHHSFAGALTRYHNGDLNYKPTYVEPFNREA